MRRQNKSKKSKQAPSSFVSNNQTRVADFTRELRSVDSRITRIQQWADYGLVTSTSAAEGKYAITTVFTDLPDNANYASAYDQYKIDSVEYHILPMTQPSLPGTAPGYANCIVYHDYDDTTTPVNAAAARQYSNAVILGPGEKHVRKIRPHIAGAATSSATASITGARNEPAPWMDATSSSVPHYGLKVVVTQSSSTNVNAWYIYAVLSVSLKNQR
jgi:hypothetical protein